MAVEQVWDWKSPRTSTALTTVLLSVASLETSLLEHAYSHFNLIL